MRQGPDCFPSPGGGRLINIPKRIMFTISHQSFDTRELKASLSHPAAGAIAVFEGRVRGRNEGKKVVFLEYEAFDGMCMREAETIISEARRLFGVLKARCVHRVGKLAVDETAVWIGVASPHREESFRACRYIIDQIKLRLPIWKKETYEDGMSGWINCACSKRTGDREDTAPENFYARQVRLSEIGREGQSKLSDSRILVVGAGGLGCAALQYLAGAGIGHIGIADGDLLEEHNLHRQILFDHRDIGQPKARLAVRRLKGLNPYIGFKSYEEAITTLNIETITEDYDIILDCTDNLTAKFLLQDICYCKQKVLVQAGVHRLEGFITVFDPYKSRSCLRCLWKSAPAVGCIENCGQTGVIGFAPGFFGVLQAAETVKYVLNLPGCLRDEILLVDLGDYHLSRLGMGKDPSCPLCGELSTKAKLHQEEKSSGRCVISLSDIFPGQIDDFEWIDLRESSEVEETPLCGIPNVHMPFSRFNWDKNAFLPGKKYLLFCAQGIRSEFAARRLRDKGLANVFSLKEGPPAIKALMKQGLKDA